jgi:hypothetical protein
VNLDVGTNRHGGGELDEVAGVAAGHVRDAADAALPPEQVIGELRHAIEMDGVDGDGAAAVDRPQRGDHDVARGRKRDRGVERFGRRFVVAACPGASQLEGA